MANFRGGTCYYIAIKKAPIEPQHFLQFIASTGNRLGLSGFTLFCSSNIPGALSYDYGIIICVFNPIRGAFKRKQLELVRKYFGKRRMRMETKNSLWHGFDFDLRTGKIREITGEENEKKKGGDYESVADLADSGRPGLSILWSEVKNRLDYFVGSYELSAPWFLGLVKRRDWLLHNYVEKFASFGLFEETLYERLLYEFHHKSPTGDGPVMGDLGADPVQRAGHIDTFWQFMELMNFQHESQVDYEGGEDE